MLKYPHIKLVKHKALTECRLENLGKINVICGKNSSGKTTLLEALQMPENRFLGVKLDEKDALALSDKWSPSVQPEFIAVANRKQYPLSEMIKQNTGLRSAIQLTLNKLQITYSNDMIRFAEQLLVLLIENMKLRTFTGRALQLEEDLTKQATKSVIIQAITKVFSQLYSTVNTEKIPQEEIAYLIPKRIIAHNAQDTNGLRTKEKIGILQRIYNIKNALPGTVYSDFYESLYSKFIEVSGDYKFNVASEDGVSDWQLYFAKKDTIDWRSAGNWGLGLQDLLVILYYSLDPTTSVVLIEEPENHLHPELQRRLLQFLKEETPDTKQFFLANHSNVFLDNTYVDKIFHTTIVDDNLKVDDATSKARMMNDLGYSPVDNLVSSLIIIVEGTSDKQVITEFLCQMGIYGKHIIKFWTLSGDFMNHVELDGFAENYNVIVLLDADPKSEENRKPFIEHCKSLDILVIKLQRYSLENYFPVEVYRESFPDRISDNITKLDHDKPVWGQLGGKIKKTDIKKGSEKFAKKTDFAAIKNTDLGRFLKKVENILEETS